MSYQICSFCSGAQTLINKDGEKAICPFCKGTGYQTGCKNCNKTTEQIIREKLGATSTAKIIVE
jgi:hypothetical protein